MSIKKAIGYDVDDVLGLVGLERRRSLSEVALPALGCALVGAVVGAGIGLMLAPSSGRRLRQEMGERVDRIRDKMRFDQMRQQRRQQQQLLQQQPQKIESAMPA